MGQELGFVLGFVLIGFLYESSSNYHRIKFLAAPNYVILYESIIRGLFHSFCAWVLMLFPKLTLAECTLGNLLRFQSCGYDVLLPFYLADVILIALAITVVRVLVENTIRDNSSALQSLVRESGLIPRLILDAADSREVVEVVTFRRKVYIGWIASGPGITSKGQLVDVAILPAWSGYRDEKTLNLEIESYYGNVLRDVRNGEEGIQTGQDSDQLLTQRLSVLIPVSDIASIRRFSKEVYDRFQIQGAVLNGQDSHTK